MHSSLQVLMYFSMIPQYMICNISLYFLHVHDFSAIFYFLVCTQVMVVPKVGETPLSLGSCLLICKHAPLICGFSVPICRYPSSICSFSLPICRYTGSICRFPLPICRYTDSICKKQKKHQADVVLVSEADGLALANSINLE